MTEFKSREPGKKEEGNLIAVEEMSEQCSGKPLREGEINEEGTFIIPILQMRTIKVQNIHSLI